MNTVEGKTIVLVLESLRIGGAERYMSTLANALIEKYNVFFVLEDDVIQMKLDKRIKVVIANNCYKKSTKLMLACKTYSIIRKMRILSSLQSRLNNYIYWEGASEKLWSTIDDIGPFNVLSMMTDINIKLLRGAHAHVNKVYSIHCNAPQHDAETDDKILCQIYKYYKMATRVVMPTESMRMLFPKNIADITTVIGNPLPENIIQPYLGQRKKNIVNFCRLNSVKNIQLLFEAFEKLHEIHPDYTVEVYGEGPEKGKLQNWIDEHQLQDFITIHPFKTNIYDLIFDSGIFVSTSKYEAFPNSTLEAMALGIPVIATDCPSGGCKELIGDNKRGLLVPMNDVEELCRAMDYVISNEEETSKRVLEAVKIRDKFSRDSIAKKFIDMMKKE